MPPHNSQSQLKLICHNQRINLTAWTQSKQLSLILTPLGVVITTLITPACVMAKCHQSQQCKSSESFMSVSTGDKNCVKSNTKSLNSIVMNDTPQRWS